jgi:hypothetical protein
MHKLVFIVASLCLFAGCSGIPKDAFVLKPSNMEDKRLESRIFAIRDETALLKDSAIILENMGYTIDRMDSDLGLLTATRHEERGGAVATIMTVLSVGLASTDKEQTYKATFTTLPSPDKRGAFIARLTLQRLVLNSDGEATTVEVIEDKDLFKLFYERLEASTFVEPDML